MASITIKSWESLPQAIEPWLAVCRVPPSAALGLSIALGASVSCKEFSAPVVEFSLMMPLLLPEATAAGSGGLTLASVSLKMPLSSSTSLSSPMVSLSPLVDCPALAEEEVGAAALVVMPVLFF
jgi:hypothetical protein